MININTNSVFILFGLTFLSRPSFADTTYPEANSWFLYSIKVEPLQQNFKKNKQIFEFDPDSAVGVYSTPTGDGDEVYSSTVKALNKSLSASLGLNASYGAFTGSASASMESSESRTHKKVRYDITHTANLITANPKGDFSSTPEKFLSPSFIKAVKTYDASELEEYIGTFYATSISFGGRIQQTYIMESTHTDSESSISSELSGSYGVSKMSGSTTQSTTSSRKDSKDNLSMTSSYVVKGGDTRILMQGGFDHDNNSVTGFDALKAEWSKTLSTESGNLAITVIDLAPTWRLVKKVDKEKGRAFRKHLKEKWKRESAKYSRHSRLKDYAYYTSIRHFLNATLRYNKEEFAKAEGYYNSKWGDRTRNWNYKEAASKNIKVINYLKEISSKSSSTTVEDFRNAVQTQHEEHLKQKNKDWGMGGHDSEEHNKVYRYNDNVLEEILYLLPTEE